MNKKRLSLYLDNICNLKCSYCNVDYSKKRTFSDKDLLEWFEKNKEMIDMRQIKLCGGEPTLIYLSLFDFLDQFESIFMITNLYDEKLIEKWVKRFGNKLKFTVSLHDEVIHEQMINIKKYREFIKNINIVISSSNLKKIQNILSEIFSIYEFYIMFLPELPNNNSEKKDNTFNILKYMNEIFNFLKNEQKIHLILNKEIIPEIKKGSLSCYQSKKISILLDGSIRQCVCNTPFYISFENKTNKKNSKYEDCKKCKKCTLYTCNDGFINNNFDYREFCVLSRYIYDYFNKEMFK